MMTESLTPSGFFVLRAPLLPLEELDRLRAESDYWLSLAQRPEVREALHLASPALVRRLDEGPIDARLAASITAYLVRMCTRATPFGLFAGCAFGIVGDETALMVDGPQGTSRRSRPDTEVLAALVDRLLADATARTSMVVEPNSSRYHAAGRMRLIESRLAGGRRSHHLTVIEEDAALQAALDAATGGATVQQVTEAVAQQAGAHVDEAREYVDALVEARVLTAVAEPPVTGPEPLVQVIAALSEQGLGEVAAALDVVADELSKLDASGVGNAPADYRGVTTALRELVPEADEARLVQVDLHRAGSGLTIGGDTVKRLGDAVGLLHKLSPNREDPQLRRFKDAFAARYEDRAVPLMEALDEELGIGFDASAHPAADESPLLADIDLGGSGADGAFTARDSVLIDLLIRARDAGSPHLELDEHAQRRLTPSAPPAMPDALSVTASLLPDGIELHGADGPSGAQVLGRFCHGDARLHAAVVAHLEAEESHAPGVVFAEVVHLPEGRIGNILARPVLRQYELVLLGRSGADADRQLGVEELTVRLEGQRLVLYSARLGAEVRPRLTTAHNPAWRSFGVYRFLAALQYDGTSGGLGWDWGALWSAPTLPRVTAGRLVLARARWRLSTDELATVTAADPEDGWATLIRKRGLPAEFFIADGDNRLYVDTASAALTGMAAKVLRGRDQAILVEALPTGVAAGPQGRFAHEVVVPFVRRAEPAPSPLPWRPPQVQRTFLPGSQWLYAKVYTGTASADRVLTDALAPVIGGLCDSGLVERWFFLRYGDPDHHLRLRFYGDPTDLRERVWPALSEALGPSLADGTVWKVVLDTYDRELERYGGDAGIELAERIHAADSTAVLDILGMLDGDEGLDARWKLCLYGTHRLLADAGRIPERAKAGNRCRPTMEGRSRRADRVAR